MNIKKKIQEKRLTNRAHTKRETFSYEKKILKQL